MRICTVEGTKASPENFTRAAVHPFCCYRGKGEEEGNDPSDPLMQLEKMENVSDEAVMSALEMQQRREEADGKTNGIVKCACGYCG